MSGDCVNFWINWITWFSSGLMWLSVSPWILLSHWLQTGGIPYSSFVVQFHFNSYFERFVAEEAVIRWKNVLWFTVRRQFLYYSLTWNLVNSVGNVDLQCATEMFLLSSWMIDPLSLSEKYWTRNPKFVCRMIRRTTSSSCGVARIILSCYVFHLDLFTFCGCQLVL